MRQGVIVKYRMLFAISVAFVFALTAVAKIVALFQKEKFLALQDQVFTQFTVSSTFKIAVLMELILVVFCLRNRKELFCMIACFWVTSLLAAYRMLLKAFYYKEPCHCTGSLLDWAHLPETVLRTIPVALLFYTGIGSLFFLVFAAMEKTSTQPPFLEVKTHEFYGKIIFYNAYHFGCAIACE